MKMAISLVCPLFLLGTCVSAQTPKQIHIDGPKALKLVSLLVSGSDEVANLIRDQHKSEIVLHDLSIVKWATQKYETDHPLYRVDVYRAQGRIGSATTLTPIHEATGLWELLNGLGMTTDAAMEGGYLNAATIDCKIDTTANAESTNRIQCDLTNPY